MTDWPTRYSEMTWQHVGALRILTAIEKAYPGAEGKGRKASTVLDGWESWRQRQQLRTPPDGKEVQG